MDAAYVRSFVDDTYRRAYGARHAATFGEYLSTGATGRAALGYRRAGAGPLYLEAYLDDPIETLVTAALGRPVPRGAIVIRQLPPQLQQIMINLQVGQATPPFGSAQDGVRALVLCGRDDPQSGQLPSADQVQNQLEQQRVNLRAEQKLRDLRRDAIIEYR